VPDKKTSPRVAREAGEVLRDSGSPKKDRSVAGSDLGQAASTKPKKKSKTSKK
jgi:hypothetical protein